MYHSGGDTDQGGGWDAPGAEGDVENLCIFCLTLLCTWNLKNRVFFRGGSEVKNLPASAGDMGSIPGFGRSPGERKGYLLQYSCLENPTDRGTLWATVHGVTKSRTRLKRLSMHAYSPWGHKESDMTEAT